MQYPANAFGGPQTISPQVQPVQQPVYVDQSVPMIPMQDTDSSWSSNSLQFNAFGDVSDVGSDTSQSSTSDFTNPRFDPSSSPSSDRTGDSMSQSTHSMSSSASTLNA